MASDGPPENYLHIESDTEPVQPVSNSSSFAESGPVPTPSIDTAIVDAVVADDDDDIDVVGLSDDEAPIAVPVSAPPAPLSAAASIRAVNPRQHPVLRTSLNRPPIRVIRPARPVIRILRPTPGVRPMFLPQRPRAQVTKVQIARPPRGMQPVIIRSVPPPCQVAFSAPEFSTPSQSSAMEEMISTEAISESMASATPELSISPAQSSNTTYTPDVAEFRDTSEVSATPEAATPMDTVESLQVLPPSKPKQISGPSSSKKVAIPHRKVDDYDYQADLDFFDPEEIPLPFEDFRGCLEEFNSLPPSEKQKMLDQLAEAFDTMRSEARRFKGHLRAINARTGRIRKQLEREEEAIARGADPKLVPRSGKGLGGKFMLDVEKQSNRKHLTPSLRAILRLKKDVEETGESPMLVKETAKVKPPPPLKKNISSTGKKAEKKKQSSVEAEASCSAAGPAFTPRVGLLKLNRD